MDKIIYCNYHLFDLHQGIYIHDPEEPNVIKRIAICPLEDLGNTIAEMCDKYNTYKVHLFGSMTEAENIVNDINTYVETKYSENKTIEIEVN